MKSLKAYITEAAAASSDLVPVWEGDDKLGGDLDKIFEKLDKFVQDNDYMFFIHGNAPGQQVCNWAPSWKELLSGAYMSRDEKYNSYKYHSIQLDMKKNCLVCNISFRPYKKDESTDEVRIWIFNKETADYFKLDCGVTVTRRNSSFNNPETGEHVFDAAKLPPLCNAPFIKAWYRPHKAFVTGMTKKEYVVPASEILSVIK